MRRAGVHGQPTELSPTWLVTTAAGFRLGAPFAHAHSEQFSNVAKYEED